MTDWQPIETAPKDGTLIQVRDRQYDPCRAKYLDGHWRFVEETSFLPTHWMPLAEPPR